MIEFKGELSDECKTYILHNNQVITVSIITFTLMPFIIISIIMAISDTSFLFGTLAVVISCIGIIILCCFIKIKGKALEDLLKYRIRIIDNEKKIVFDGPRFYREHKLDDVTKIIDYGNFYRICFCPPTSGKLVPCQKNLITQGSIEEFEKLFEGLIVKRKFKYKPKDKK